jgi:hypothetical protein
VRNAAARAEQGEMPVQRDNTSVSVWSRTIPPKYRILPKRNNRFPFNRAAPRRI